MTICKRSDYSDSKKIINFHSLAGGCGGVAGRSVGEAQGFLKDVERIL